MGGLMFDGIAIYRLLAKQHPELVRRIDDVASGQEARRWAQATKLGRRPPMQRKS